MIAPQQLPAADSLRRVLRSVFAGPDYRWSRRADPLATLKLWWAALARWWQDLHGASSIAAWVVVGIVVLALVAITAHTIWTFSRAFRRAPPSPLDVGVAPARRDQAWYRSQADRLATAGRYAEAMQADFIALILALDTRDVVRFHPSKTPGEYAGEARLEGVARADFRDLVRRLYACVFGRVGCGPGEFADWRARIAAERYAPAD